MWTLPQGIPVFQVVRDAREDVRRGLPHPEQRPPRLPVFCVRQGVPVHENSWGTRAERPYARGLFTCDSLFFDFFLPFFLSDFCASQCTTSGGDEVLDLTSQEQLSPVGVDKDGSKPKGLMECWEALPGGN